MADTPRDRLALITKTITAHRTRASGGVVFETDGGQLSYEDRTITLEPPDRERIEAVLQSFPVFKIEQPATRKASADVVHISAIADPKHTADFIEQVFRRVYDHGEGYELRIVEP